MKTIAKLILIIPITYLFSCGPSKPDLSSWSFAGADSLKVESVKSNGLEKLSVNVLGSVEENETWIVESLKNSGFTEATMVHELMDFTGEVDDYKLNLRIIDGQLDPFEALKEKDHFIKGNEGVKVSVYESTDKGNPTTVRLEKYAINNTQELHEKAVALRKSMIFGEFSLNERNYLNLNNFKGDTLKQFESYLEVYKLLKHSLRLIIREDGTYEESFPFLEGSIIIKGTWEITDNLKYITFNPSDLSGENLTDSYFISNDNKENFSTVCLIKEFNKDGMNLIATKIFGLEIYSSFIKLNL